MRIVESRPRLLAQTRLDDALGIQELVSIIAGDRLEKLLETLAVELLQAIECGTDAC